MARTTANSAITVNGIKLYYQIETDEATGKKCAVITGTDADKFDLSNYDTETWSKLLSEQPQLADGRDIPWKKFKPREWVTLLVKQPQFAMPSGTAPSAN